MSSEIALQTGLLKSANSVPVEDVGTVDKLDGDVRKRFLSELERAGTSLDPQKKPDVVRSDVALSTVSRTVSPEVSQSQGDEIIKGMGWVPNSTGVEKLDKGVEISARSTDGVKSIRPSNHAVDFQVNDGNRAAVVPNVTAEKASITDLDPVDADLLAEGLLKLRKELNRRIKNVEVLSADDSGSVSAVHNAKVMLDLQMQLMEFALFIELMGKTTGQATHALDSLLKGQ